MAFGMFSAQCSPIAIDFGSASVKLLQIGTGDRPPLIAAAELALPPGPARTPAEQMEFYGEQLPGLARQAGFKGKRAVCSVPSSQTFIQHMQISAGEGADLPTLAKAQLQSQFGWSPDAIVVRTQQVVETHRDGQARIETVCLAMTRETVMRHIELLRKCRLEVVGVHTELMAMVRAFDHIHRRQGDEKLTTMYIDLGYGGTKVAIGHGKQMVFAKCIQIGGRNFDQLISETLRCDFVSAKAHRLSQDSSVAFAARAAAARAGAAGATSGNAAAAELPAILRAGMQQAKGESASASGGDTATAPERRSGNSPPELRQKIQPGQGPTPPAQVDFTELLEAISDELSMCVRYHQSLFPGRALDRVVFLGGEARQIGLCRHIAQVLRVPAQLGDPLARLVTVGTPETPGLTLGQPQPGWAVPFGLCMAPTDL